MQTIVDISILVGNFTTSAGCLGAIHAPNIGPAVARSAGPVLLLMPDEQRVDYKVVVLSTKLATQLRNYCAMC